MTKDNEEPPNLRLILFVGILCAIALTAFATINGVSAGDDDHPKTVNSKDLLKRVQIIGELGQPLCQIMTVRGVWLPPQQLVKDPTKMTFRIDEVNGKKLEQPVDFSQERVFPALSTGKATKNERGSPATWKADWNEGNDKNPEPKADARWELVCIETGEIQGFPDAVWKKLGTAVQQYYGFRTKLFYVDVKFLEGKTE